MRAERRQLGHLSIKTSQCSPAVCLPVCTEGPHACTWHPHLGFLSFSLGMCEGHKHAVAPTADCPRSFQQWAFAEGGMREIWANLPSQGQSLFPLLRTAADLLMMPKELLLEAGIREDLIASVRHTHPPAPPLLPPTTTATHARCRTTPCGRFTRASEHPTTTTPRATSPTVCIAAAAGASAVVHA